jgi:hypothetical protein
VLFCVQVVQTNNNEYVYSLLFTILCPFGTRESIRRKVDHGGHIVLWYLQCPTNLARATMFVICMSSARVLVWVRGKAEQKHSLTFYVFGQTRSKCFSSSTSPNRSLDKASLRMACPSTHLTLPQTTCCHTETRPKLSVAEHS